MEIKNYTYKASKKGKHVLIFGAIHGNETCGTVAINNIMKALNDGSIELLKGQVTFIPICNQAAYNAEIRYIDQDLNRCIMPHSKPTTNEQKIANILCPLIENCDILLDIHSMTSKSTPSTFEEMPSDDNKTLIRSLHVNTIYTDWGSKYKKTAQMSTTGYAKIHDTAAATLECGQHKSSEAPHVAYENILNVLSAFGMVKHDIKPFPKPIRAKYIQTVIKEDGAEFVKVWSNMDTLKKGDVIGKLGDKKFISPIDGVIIMPSIQAKPGGEWYYLGQIL
tara:strand:+ start:121084 stop:121920 length:837 start_codon:yes stop_codon:yes gene_type:complete